MDTPIAVRVLLSEVREHVLRVHKRAWALTHPSRAWVVFHAWGEIRRVLTEFSVKYARRNKHLTRFDRHLRDVLVTLPLSRL